MNLRSVVELLALLSAHSPTLIQSGSGIPGDTLQRYWTCSGAQARLWLAELDRPQELQLDGIIAELGGNPPDITPVFADILLGGMSVRVWGAIILACDKNAGGCEGVSIARGVLAQHNLVWNRMLKYLVVQSDESPEPARLDQLRRKVERWTDILVGHLVRRYGVTECAFDADRARDFGDEQLSDGGRQELHVWDLYLTCLRTSFPALKLPRGRLNYLREEQLRQMLASYPPEVFSETGTMKPAWLYRLESANPPGERPHLPLRKRIDERLSP